MPPAPPADATFQLHLHCVQGWLSWDDSNGTHSGPDTVPSQWKSSPGSPRGLPPPSSLPVPILLFHWPSPGNLFLVPQDCMFLCELSLHHSPRSPSGLLQASLRPGLAASSLLFCYSIDLCSSQSCVNWFITCLSPPHRSSRGTGIGSIS